MTDEDKKVVKEAEVFLGNLYWVLLNHKENKLAARAQALALELARVRGYKGD